MAQPPLSREAAQAALDAWARHNRSWRAAAEELGIAKATFENRLKRAREMELRPGGADWQGAEPAAEFPAIPSAEPSYAELKERMKADFARLSAHKEASKLLRVKVKIDGPYGIMPIGDPHLDNNGTDWPLLDRHVNLIKRTEGLFGTNVGDTSDNWVGRLARLYADSNLSRKRALILIEGFMREVRWLFVDKGNHDAWSGVDDPIAWFARDAGTHYKWEGSRVELVSPCGSSIVINSRHDFPGRSQYHPTHGPLKAATFDDHSDDIYTCGHIHIGGYMLRVSPTGKISHLLRLSSYKVYDSFKDQRGFLDGHLPSSVFVVNPAATDPLKRVKYFADPEDGADYLTFLRRPRVRVQARAA